MGCIEISGCWERNMEVAERVAAAEAELAAVAREVADLEKRIRACRGRVLSKAPALAANSRLL